MGCVPSKCLVAAAKALQSFAELHHWASSVLEAGRRSTSRA